MAGRTLYLILLRHQTLKTVDLLVTESANVLWKSARTGLIEKEQVGTLYSSMELLVTQGPLTLKPAQLFMAEALSIALSLDTPVYDAIVQKRKPTGITIRW